MGGCGWRLEVHARRGFLSPRGRGAGPHGTGGIQSGPDGVCEVPMSYTDCGGRLLEAMVVGMDLSQQTLRSGKRTAFAGAAAQAREWAWDGGGRTERSDRSVRGQGGWKLFIRSARPCVSPLLGQWGLRGKGCGDLPQIHRPGAQNLSAPGPSEPPRARAAVPGPHTWGPGSRQAWV